MQLLVCVFSCMYSGTKCSRKVRIFCLFLRTRVCLRVPGQGSGNCTISMKVLTMIDVCFNAEHTFLAFTGSQRLLFFAQFFCFFVHNNRRMLKREV